MAEFRMPSLGADMTEGTLLEWQVAPGQHVHRGDVVAVVDTDKAAIEVEVFEDGVIEELLVEPGVRVPVGTPLARVSSGETSAPAVVSVPQPRSAPAPVRPAPRSSPLARRRATAAGVDLSTVRGTGPGGAVTAADLAALTTAPAVVPAPAAPAAPAAPLPPAAATQRPEPAPPLRPADTDRAGSMRRAIGELMSRSKREIPHYYLSTTIDLTTATAWLARENAQRDVAARLVPAALLLKATARAARAVPEVNGTWTDGRLVPAEHVHLGVAIALRTGGLVTPAILDADTLDLDALMARLRDVVGRARSGRLRQSEMTSGTLTVTNLGDQGVESVFGVIYPPQVALVGFGRVTDQPVARDGLLGVRPCVIATLSGDHRATDGHRGGVYLATIDRLLQEPEAL